MDKSNNNDSNKAKGNGDNRNMTGSSNGSTSTWSTAQQQRNNPFGQSSTSTGVGSGIRYREPFKGSFMAGVNKVGHHTNFYWSSCEGTTGIGANRSPMEHLSLRKNTILYTRIDGSTNTRTDRHFVEVSKQEFNKKDQNSK